MVDSNRPLKVFLCHASADKPKVRELYRALKQRGMQPWLDAEDLLPGQNWEIEIPKALFSSDVIIVCLSPNSVDKEGYVQKEIKFALDKALEMPDGRIFLIPARLEHCDLPENLSKFYAVNLFEKSGYAKLTKALRVRASQLRLAEASPSDVETNDIEEDIQDDSKNDGVDVGGDVSGAVIVRGDNNIIHMGQAETSGSSTERIEREKVKREAAEKAKQEKNARQIGRKAEVKKALNGFIATVRSVSAQSKPFFRIVGIIGIIIVLFWVALKFISPVPAALPTISPTVVLTITPPKLFSSLTPSKTIMPSFTPTTTSTVTPTLTPTFVPTPITSTVLIMDGPRQNCRVNPNGEIVDYIAPGTNVLAFGRNENSDWLFIKIQSNEKYCWIKTDGVQYQVDEIAGLPLGMVYSKGVEMVLIPSGKFTMGDHVDTLVNACKHFDKVSENCDRSIFYDILVKDVYLAPFYIDKYEVSNLQYKSCVDAGVCKPPDLSKSQTREKYYGNPQYDKYPVVYVTWEKANTYCQWRGDRLPSEAEWEKAARGTDGRLFPWGSDFTGKEANFRDKNYDKTISYDDGNKDTAPVNAYIQGISPYGIYNMAGNVWEWVLDKYTENPDDFRMVFRGGAWSHPVYALFSSNRGTNSMLYSEYNIGFRCARDASP